MRRGKWTAAGIAAGMLLAGDAAAQTTSGLPNYGNYRGLDGTFRVGVNVTNALNGFSEEDAFEQDEIDGIIDYLDPFEIVARVGQVNAQSAAITGVFDIRGASAVAGYAQNSPTLTVRIVRPDGTTYVNRRGQQCLFSYAGATRQDSFDQFDEAVDDAGTPTARAIQNCLTESLVRFSPVDPLAGNPNSLQSTLARSSLDLSAGDSLIEEAGAGGDFANTAGDPWIIGASVGFGSAGRFDLLRVDGRIARGFRVFEGGRGRLKIDLPFNYSRINDTAAFGAQLGIGLELPLSRAFSIEPRVAYGATGSATVGQVGHIAQGTVAGRYVLHGVGRGRLVLGLMGGYSQTLGTPFTELDLNPGLKNGVFRGGLAYETPLGMRIGGRLTSVRASYSHTRYTGDELFNNNFHEATLSFGLRTREEQARGTRDLVRFNVGTIQADAFQQYTLGLGFRF